MMKRMETQASVCGEGRYRAVSGCVRVSPMACGSAVQVHVKGLPCADGFIGLCAVICGREYRLPPLLACQGEAIMSVYVCAFSPEETIGGQIILTADTGIYGERVRVASGRFEPVSRPGCFPPAPQPRPVGRIHW